MLSIKAAKKILQNILDNQNYYNQEAARARFDAVKQHYRQAFQSAPTVQKRLKVLYVAACSGFWAKCQGALVDDSNDPLYREKQCFAGFICDLAGMHRLGHNYFRLDREGNMILVGDEQSNKFYKKLVGFNPWASVTNKAAKDKFLKPLLRESQDPAIISTFVGANDESSATLCQLAGACSLAYDVPTKTQKAA